MNQISIIKRDGERSSEAFQLEKLHASILAACLSVRSPEGLAETTAHSVCQHVFQWCEPKSEVTSRDLRRKASEALQVLHPEAAYLYKHHRFVI